MSTETLATDDRMDLDCIVGNVTARIITKCGIVYQGTVLDWDCGGYSRSRSDSCSPSSGGGNQADSLTTRTDGGCCRSFIRMELDCIPGNICCPIDPNGATGELRASRVTAILGSVAQNSMDAVFTPGTTVLINWDDVSSVGAISSSSPCLTTL